MFDWSKKHIGPPGIAPELCPLCGVDMKTRLWQYFILHGREHLRCQKCGEVFDLEIVRGS